MFSHISQAPADPILGLVEAFKADPRPHKINLSIGVYKNAVGEIPMFACVKQAETELLKLEQNKNYLSIDGIATYSAFTQTLLFGNDAEILRSKRAVTCQSLGGTGALRIAAELARLIGIKKVWISNPTWPNHLAIFQAVGIEIAEYRYYNHDCHTLDWENMLIDLSQANNGDLVLLHGCCHNPTGIDPTPAQWRELAKLSATRGWLPLFDLAYQGFANGLDEDAQGLRTFVDTHAELLVASSYSKNFGLYNERVGAFTLVAKDATSAQKAQSQIKRIIRTLYSNPPFHGAACVNLILADTAKRQQWETELLVMRERIKQIRNQLVTSLQANGVNQDFSFITAQNGMFSFSSLTPEQVARLKKEFAIYIAGSSRINVAGITPTNIGTIAHAIAQVL